MHRIRSRYAVWLACAGALMMLACARGDARPFVTAHELSWQALNGDLLPHVTITALAFDPRNPQRLYAGTAGPGGVWISEDGGSSGRFADGELAGRVAYALSVDIARPDELLAGTDAGVYQSSDAGRTWQREEAAPAAAIFALARDAMGAVWAGGAGPEVYRRPAGTAAAWQKVSVLPDVTAVPSLAVSPRGGPILAGTDRAGLFRSDDGGRTWHGVPEIGRTFVAELAFPGPDGRVAFAGTGLGLYATDDGGATWHPEATAPGGRVDALAVDGQGDAYAGTSEGDLYRRAAGSETWRPWGTGMGKAGLFASLLVAPGASARWYAGTYDGLYLSDDGGLAWRLAQPGPGFVEVTALAVAADGSLFLGNRDGIFRSTDDGMQWELRSTGLPAGTILALAPATGDANLIYAGLGRGLYRSVDGGTHWVPTGWMKRGVPGVLVDPRDPHHVFIRVAFERVYESRDGGQTWVARWDGLGLATEVISLAMDPQQPDTLYAGAAQGFFRSGDGAGHWEKTGGELAGQTVFSIVVDPRDGRDLYVGATNGTYRSRDGGEHWEPWGKVLENVTVTSLVFSSRERGLVYAGTKYRGVFESRDGGEHWAHAGPGPVSVGSLLMPADDQRLYAATATGLHAMQVPTR